MEEINLRDLSLPRLQLLKRALANSRPAHSTKIEWRGESVHGRIRENYTQIIRTPWKPKANDSLEIGLWLGEHLQAIEEVIWFGTPSRDDLITTCGGVIHFLGDRDPVEGDLISYRPLRETVLRYYDGIAELLTEFSLQIEPAPPIARRR